MSLSRKVFSKVELPRNFYTKIILLENAYYLYPSQDKIAELLSLYQKGIEFYSSQSNKERADDLSDKIKMFLTATQTMKVVKESKNRIENNQRTVRDYEICAFAVVLGINVTDLLDPITKRFKVS